MEITEVRITPAKGGKIRAFASIVIDDCFIVNDLRVVEGREGQVFVTMPARKVRNGQLRDIAHPLNSDTRAAVEEKVLEEFHRAADSQAIPTREGKAGNRQNRSSPLPRLAGRLFADEYWTIDPREIDDQASK
jgi:stage V sporulation protein G